MEATYQSNKRAVSVMVAYVILITMTLALTTIVYQWLRETATEKEVPDCPSGVNVIISNLSCSDSGNGQINLTLKNKGRFTVEDILVRVSNNPNSRFGVEKLTTRTKGIKIAPGGENSTEYTNLQKDVGYKKPVLIDIQPFYRKDSELILCNSYVIQKISCSAAAGVGGGP